MWLLEKRRGKEEKLGPSFDLGGIAEGREKRLMKYKGWNERESRTREGEGWEKACTPLNFFSSSYI